MTIQNGELTQSMAGADPVGLLIRWHDAAAEDNGEMEASALALATVNRDGEPSVRMVLCKGIDPGRGTVRFFTNLDSDKAHDLAANPAVSGCFWWAGELRQARVSGRVERVAHEQDDAYFVTRPIGARVGAWASHQSKPVESREALDARVAEERSRMPGDDVPLPPWWGGFDIVIDRIEFWQSGRSRLHDRIAYVRDTGAPPDGWSDCATRVIDPAGVGWWRTRLQP